MATCVGRARIFPCSALSPSNNLQDPFVTLSPFKLQVRGAFFDRKALFNLSTENKEIMLVGQETGQVQKWFGEQQAETGMDNTVYDVPGYLPVLYNWTGDPDHLVGCWRLVVTTSSDQVSTIVLRFEMGIMPRSLTAGEVNHSVLSGKMPDGTPLYCIAWVLPKWNFTNLKHGEHAYFSTVSTFINLLVLQLGDWG